MTDYVVGSGTASSTSIGLTLAGGDFLVVTSGGQAISTAVSAGAAIDVAAGGASGTILSSGAFALVESGGLAVETTVQNGGTLIVLPGASVANSDVNDGGAVISAGVVLISAAAVPGYGAANDPVAAFAGSGSGYDVSAGETEIVLPGGVAVGGSAVRAAGFAQPDVEVYGQTSGLVASGGIVEVYSGGIASGTTGAYPGGPFLIVNSGGTAVATIDGAPGADDLVFSGGIAVGTIVDGGQEAVSPGGVESGASVIAGNILINSGGLSVDPTAGGDAGLLNDYGSVVSATISGGGTLWLQQGATLTGAVVQSGGQIADFGGTAFGVDLLVGGGVDIPSFADPDAVSATILSGNVLAVTSGATTFDLQLDPGEQLDAATFSEQAYGNYPGGTLVTLEAACFLPGTLIATPTGAVPVETLHIGDLVALATGGSAPVRWVARQTLAPRFAADRLRASPIRIRAGALAEGVPARDLLVSADHALFVDGVLVQAGALVNGTSIRRETDVPARLTYYNLELATHALILAEGVAAESFVDNVGRDVFDNAAEHAALYPDAPPIAEMAHPRAKSHRQVPASLRRRLDARAGPPSTQVA